MENISGRNFVFGILGAIAGGVIGYILFSVLVRQGLYAIAMPGALVGLGCGLASRIKSRVLGIVCALASLGLGIYLEWSFFPFMADGSLAYFITHLSDLKPARLVFIVLGGFFGFWFGTGRTRRQQTSSG